MHLPKNIKPYPKFFKYLPISDKGFTSLMSRTIYVSKDIYLDLQKSRPKPWSIAVLKHQEVHAHNAGVFKTVKFVLFKNFRLKEEILAYTEMFKYLKKHNQTFNFDQAAKDFSKLRYLWMTSEEEGNKILTKIWHEV